ncbi:Flp1 family type IVb pilin [Cohnella panacarvi]|uniref:Flp1 family type IVb pilin n=1 Tax=Cohnella panacarvi TaxID=400776 RepID=UPI00047E2992|nr:Flp1 family type IVb pilin [Cohnella panacarvi]
MRASLVALRKAGIALWRNEKGMGTLEIVLIVAVLIAVVLVFKDQIITFLNGLMDKVTGKSDELFE